MAFPLGHAAVGVAAFFTLEKKEKRNWRHFLWFGFISIVPDLDIFIGPLFGLEPFALHRAFSHGIVALFLVCFTVFLVFRFILKRSWGEVTHQVAIAALLLIGHFIIDSDAIAALRHYPDTDPWTGKESLSMIASSFLTLRGIILNLEDGIIFGLAFLVIFYLLSKLIRVTKKRMYFQV